MKAISIIFKNKQIYIYIYIYIYIFKKIKNVRLHVSMIWQERIETNRNTLFLLCSLEVGKTHLIRTISREFNIKK